MRFDNTKMITRRFVAHKSITGDAGYYYYIISFDPFCLLLSLIITLGIVELGMVLCIGVCSTVLRTSEPPDRVSDSSDLILIMNDSQLLVVKIKSEL